MTCAVFAMTSPLLRLTLLGPAARVVLDGGDESADDGADHSEHLNPQADEPAELAQVEQAGRRSACEQAEGEEHTRQCSGGRRPSPASNGNQASRYQQDEDTGGIVGKSTPAIIWITTPVVAMRRAATVSWL